MGKQEEIRCLDVEGWWSRQSFGCAYNYSSDWECLVRLNQLIVEADRMLYGHNEIYPMYYESKEKKIEELGYNFSIYLNYVDNLPNDIKAIDHAFYVDITSNAVQNLSKIKQEKYFVQEGVLAEKYGGVTLEDYVVGQRVHYYRTLGRQTIELVELQEFSEMLQSNFQEQAQANGMETEEYILKMLENGEYDHQAYHPGEDFVSGLLDTGSLGVKPLLEIMAGHDFVTGEEMTETLKKEKSFEVIMGMIAILGAPSTKIGSQGKRGIVTQLGIEMATGAVGYTIYETGEAIDLPPGLTMVATLAGGALTYRFLEGRILRVDVSLGKYLDDMTEVAKKTQKSIIKSVENSPSGTKGLTNLQKGNYGEMKMDVFFESQGYERISLDRTIDLNEPTHHGIDGVYYNSDGHPPYIIGEAKYGSSKLGSTLDGKQMSDNWIDKRLVDAVGVEKADDIILEMMINPDNVQKQLVNISVDGKVSTKILDENANIIK